MNCRHALDATMYLVTYQLGRSGLLVTDYETVSTVEMLVAVVRNQENILPDDGLRVTTL